MGVGGARQAWEESGQTRSLPEVLDANHLAPGPGPVHGPTVWICTLRQAGHISPGHNTLLPTLRDPWVLVINQQSDLNSSTSLGLYDWPNCVESVQDL